MDEGHLPTSPGSARAARSVGWKTFATTAPRHRGSRSYRRAAGQTGEWGHVTYDPARYLVDERSAYGFIKYPPFCMRTSCGSTGRGLRSAACAARRRRRRHSGDRMGYRGEPVLEVIASARVDGGTDRPPRFAPDVRVVSRGGESGRRWGRDLFVPDPQQLRNRADVRASRPALRRRAPARQSHAGPARPRRMGLLPRRVFGNPYGGPPALASGPRAPAARASDARPGGEPPVRCLQGGRRGPRRRARSIAPDGAHVVLFSIYGIGANVLDLPSMAFLPELLYRWSFPGKTALGIGDWTIRSAAPAPTGLPRALEGRNLAPASPRGGGRTRLARSRRREAIRWPGNPPTGMTAMAGDEGVCASHEYSEGLIRINLQGRDAHGLVSPQDYGRTCDEICENLAELRDARTGVPMVREVVRTRSGPADDEAGRPPADLDRALWQEEAPTDVVAGVRTGRIGPFPYFRSGGHCSRGFIAATGPGVSPSSRLPGSSAQDLTATLLCLLGHPVPGTSAVGRYPVSDRDPGALSRRTGRRGSRPACRRGSSSRRRAARRRAGN